MTKSSSLAKGVTYFLNHKLVRLLFAEGKVVGVTMKDAEGVNHDYYAPVVMAAWGGVGRMLDGAKDHPDLEGSPVGIAWQLGPRSWTWNFWSSSLPGSWDRGIFAAQS